MKNNLSAEIHQGLLNLGINGLLIPEEFGGLGLDLLFAAVVSEALGGGVGPYSIYCTLCYGANSD